MKRTIKRSSLLLLFISSIGYGQMENYNYKREIKGISGQWNKLILPNEIFGKTLDDLLDIRIFGISATKDTIEAPYLIRVLTEKILNQDIPFKIINVTKNNNGCFFTFEVSTTKPINRIDLDFKQKNFDWRIKLEGSQNNTDWFTIINNYRILSIKNEIADFKFNKLIFSSSNYRFYRLFINSKENVALNEAKISEQTISKGKFRNYTIKKIYPTENKEYKQTEIDVDLQMPVPISFFKLKVKDSLDFYRHLTIKYLTDSVKTEQGFKYNYNTLTSGTLNSFENDGFKFNSTIAQKLKIIIDNQDNKHLTIDSVEVKGYEQELIVRLTEQATYYFTYGNKLAVKPLYDIENFADKIPIEITTLQLGNEETIDKAKVSITAPLFKNKIWLWIIMSIIILVLGWFSVKMIANNKAE